MLATGAMARSVERGWAMWSEGLRAVAVAWCGWRREWPQAFGDGAKHRAEVSAGDDIQGSANDRVVERDTHGGMSRGLGIGGSEAA